MKIKDLIIVILAIACLASVYFLVIKNNTNSEDQSSTVKNENLSLINESTIYSPKYNYLVKQITNNDLGAQSIELIDLKTKETYILDTININSRYHSLMFGNSGQRLYFGRTNKLNSNTTLFYIDLMDFNPSTVTEITSRDLGPLTGEYKIVGESGDTVYIRKDNNLYSLMLDFNAVPVLVTTIPD